MKPSARTPIGALITTRGWISRTPCGLSTLLEPLEPYFCEDLVRSENPGVYRELRKQVKVPIAVGEQFGTRWEFNEMVEQHLIDYNRVEHSELRRRHRIR